ncbi:protein of unknown function (plasmid) [Shinella sp. WSC3-e]|nr:protein of unknown function [Shinella sp. WSC3-e]
MNSHRDMRLGDLSVMIGSPERRPEILFNPRGRRFKLLNNRPFLPGNSDNVAISFNLASASTKRLLAIGDSFLFNSLASLSTFYRDILYVRSSLFQPDLLDLFAPDDVVTANAERYLAQVQPDHTADSVIMRCYGRPNYIPSADFSDALRAQLSYRAYPATYQAWSTEMNAASFNRLGPSKTNSDLLPISGSESQYEVTGVDPQIIYTDPLIEVGRTYRLHITMETNVKSISQLFIQRSPSAGGDYSTAITVPVFPGKNQITFEIPASENGESLRFDPLNNCGRINIVHIELVEC